MEGQQLAQELNYQAGVMAQVEKINQQHTAFVSAKNAEKQKGLGIKALAIIAGIAFLAIYGATSMAFLAIIAVVAIVGGYYYYKNNKNKKIDEEISQENSIYQNNYGKTVNQLSDGDHPKFNLPDGRYTSSYLKRLSNLVSTGQANDIGTAIRTLEDRLRLEQNTVASNRAANNSAIAANNSAVAANNSAVAADNSAIAAGMSAVSAANSSRAERAANNAAAAGNRAAAASNRAANIAQSIKNKIK